MIAISYGFAGYLVYRRYRPLGPVVRSAAVPRSPGELIATADAQLRNNNVEQALVRYREALAQQAGFRARATGRRARGACRRA